MCASIPSLCGRGKCISVQTGYTCLCEPGFKLSALQTNCIDVNECDENPCEGKGRCINSHGSYSCQCHSGYSQVITQNRKFCQDINECSMPNKCQNGKCVNTEGSYTCECNSGFAKSWRGQCEGDFQAKIHTAAQTQLHLSTFLKLPTFSSDPSQEVNFFLLGRENTCTIRKHKLFVYK
ncbi:latent-transforming growth factor beta-binding protein 2-like isoform X1 [Oryzias melastigma]|uniref:latent-transforming growth factor beta-binding protein 2-like isoform X1 n=1 Tax=Oryzias melastigma TaxID=30732 RepID=UPI00168D2270|nr:latent-transforming growth factor beta-binding protein 2-like isoform X1 [Oryzias melastigma]